MRQRNIFWFWLPLFASWLLMTAEGPVISAVINRLPNEVVMLAAVGIVVSLSVMIESPIINLLSTSTALVRDRASYMQVQKFTIHWLILLTIITVLVAFTPLFDLVVVRWLEAPPEVAEWVLPGMQIMMLWSAAIGWRRFLQGVLIHFDMTRQVAWGTVVRLLSSGSLILVLALGTDWAGAISASIALMVGVTAEAAYVTWAVQPLFKAQLSVDAPSAEGDPLTYRDLFWFHLPLAGTAVLILLAQPLVTSSLARLDNPTESLAAWPVLFQLMLMARAAAFALPEVVIALSKGHETFAALRKFSLRITAVLTAITAIIAFTPVADFYLFNIQDMTESTGLLTQTALPLFLLFPAFATLASWFRGLLISSRHTVEINIGMVVNLVLTGIILIIGLQLRWAGLPTAAIALNVAVLFELVYLGWRTQLTLPKGLTLFGAVTAQKKLGLEIGD